MLKSGLRGILILFVMTGVILAQSTVDLKVIHKIKMEGLQNSEVMKTISYLADVYGPRLTGSPELREASEWARDQMKKWGISNVKLEDWGTFGRSWTMQKASVHMTAPRYTPLIAYPKSWTRSTDGTIIGTPVVLEIDSEDQLEAFKDSLEGAIVMRGKPREWAPKFEAI